MLVEVGQTTWEAPGIVHNIVMKLKFIMHVILRCIVNDPNV